jgi:hypothetical protein
MIPFHIWDVIPFPLTNSLHHFSRWLLFAPATRLLLTRLTIINHIITIIINHEINSILTTNQPSIAPATRYPSHPIGPLASHEIPKQWIATSRKKTFNTRLVCFSTITTMNPMSESNICNFLVRLWEKNDQSLLISLKSRFQPAFFMAQFCCSAMEITTTRKGPRSPGPGLSSPDAGLGERCGRIAFGQPEHSERGAAWRGWGAWEQKRMGEIVDERL